VREVTLNKHLLHRTEQSSGEPRLEMLETIREYGQECLSLRGEAEQTQGAHAAYYLQLAEEAEAHLFGAEQERWFDRLEQEHDNLRTALNWSVECGEAGQSMEMALQLAGALVRFWAVRGYVREGQRFLERALVSNERVRTSVWAKALNGAGWLAGLQGDVDRAEMLCQESLALYRELGDRRSAALALHRLGVGASMRSKYAEARSLLDESLALYRQIGDKAGLAYSLMALGSVTICQGEYIVARSLLEESLALFSEMSNKEGMAWSLFYLGRAFFAQGDQTKADALVGESLTLFRELNLKEGVAFCLHLLGQFALAQGKAPTARSLLQEGLALFRALGKQRETAYVLSHLASVAIVQGDNATADALNEESLALFQAIAAQGQALISDQPRLQAQATKRKPASPTYPKGLTQREVEVLRLVAQGLTDMQVAEALVISPRTVNAHLRSVYSKLGMTSRHAARRYALEHHLV
jgi:DNA-binding CsgD family transcriptional regulator